MRLNNATNIRVGLIDARFPESGQLSFDDTADVDTGQAATQSGPVSGVYVDRWIGVKAVGNYPIGFNMPTQTVSNVRINGIKFDGFTVGFIAFAAGTTVGGFIEFQGAIAGAGALVFSNLPDNDTVRLDLMIDGVRVVGPARQITRMAGTTLVVAGDPFNPADTGTLSAAALDVQTAKGTAGDGNYGAGLALHGPAGGRRRAAIASRQMGANSHNVGISFLTNAGSAGSDALVEVLGLKPGGGIRGGLPTFANNAAAVSGGLAANDWYKTASGEFRIVV